MDSHGRSAGCVSACPHASICVEVPAFQGEWQGVSVYMPPFQIGYIFMRVYETPMSSHETLASAGDKTSCLPRLANPNSDRLNCLPQLSFRSSSISDGLSTSTSLNWFPCGHSTP